MYLKVVLVICLQILSIIGTNALLPLITIAPGQILPVVTPPPAYTKCPIVGYEYWITFDNKTCYYLYYGRVSWHEANDNCHRQKSELVSIHSLTENTRLANYAPPNNYIYYITNNLFWTGLNSLSKRGVYKWSDGSPRQFTHFSTTNMNGSPINGNNFQGRCVGLKYSRNVNNINLRLPSAIGPNNGVWYYDDCNSRNSYICEKNPGQLPVPPTPIPPGNCASDWVQYANEKCIKFLDNVKLTWAQAKAKCTAIGGEMLSIHSAEEQNFITSLVADKASPYIGINKNTTLLTWGWSDESRIDYTNWAPVTNYATYYVSNCVVLLTNELQAGKWNTTLCNSTHSVICEKEKDPQNAVVHKNPYTACNISGFDKFIQYRNSCYLFVDDPTDPNRPQTFDNAEKICTQKNAHLVSIGNPYENAFIKYYLAQYGKSDQFWIGFYAAGFSEVNVTQTFKWTDNWPNYFTNWDDDEPLFAGQTDEECVFLSRSNGTWRTGDCVSSKAYICKTTANPLPKMGDEVHGICPKISNTERKFQWVDVDKRSKYCYWFSSDLGNDYYGMGTMSWGDASFHCKKRNGTLASIHSDHELALMRSKILRTDTQTGIRGTWIGLFKTQFGDYTWEDGTAIDYTNWGVNQTIVNYLQRPVDDNSRDMCVEVDSGDLKWRQFECTGYAARKDYFICQTMKVSTNSGSSGLSGGAKAGIVIGVLLFVGIIVGAIFMVRRYKLNGSSFPSFDNKMYSSRRGPNQRANGPAFSNMSNDITNTENDNPFNKQSKS